MQGFWHNFIFKPKFLNSLVLSLLRKEPEQYLINTCHRLKQGVNKLSDRCSLLTPTLPPEEGKRRKRERDLQIEYKKFY